MKNLRKITSEYLCIAFGSFLVALAVNCFLVPFKLSTGGVSGIGTIFFYMFKIPVSVSVIALNVLLFFIAYKTLEKTVLIKTACGILLLSLFLEITFPIGAFTDDIFVSSLFGGVLTGTGVGITLYNGASTGGSDFASVLIKGLVPHISLGIILLCIDLMIILISGFVFKNYTLMLYSIISLYTGAKITDFILVRGDVAKCVWIISQKNTAISNAVISKIGRGITGIYSKGIYYNSDFTMLMCVVKPKEIPHLLKLVKSIDENSFVIVSQVKEVHGMGFK